MSESVTHKRAGAATDEDGNPIGGALTTVKTITGCRVAPMSPESPTDVGRDPIVTGYTVYVRTTTDLDIRPNDVFTVRGLDLPLEGIAGVWRDKSGAQKGVQFAVKVVAG